MGYALHLFVSNIDDNLVCSICGSVLQDAVLTPCGHSFCQGCLTQWLTRSEVEPFEGSCPECRSAVTLTGQYQARPIRAIRNIISNFTLGCPYRDLGCTVLLKLERLQVHQDTCGFAPVLCVGCENTMSRHRLASHQLSCEGIYAELSQGSNECNLLVDAATQTDTDDDQHQEEEEEEEEEDEDRLCYNCSQSLSLSQISNLTSRLQAMDQQVQRLLKDLEISEARCRTVERENKRTKEELQQKRKELLNLQFQDFDPEYEYGHTTHSMTKLTHLLCRHLYKKPAYIDKDRVMMAVKRCYEKFSVLGNISSLSNAELHMLLATAWTCSWFTDSQRMSLNLWLSSVARQSAQSNTRSSASSTTRLLNKQFSSPRNRFFDSRIFEN